MRMGIRSTRLLTARRCLTKTNDCRLFIRTVDTIAVRVTRIVAMPMTEYVVITTRPAEFWQHVMASRSRQRIENAGLMTIDKFPLHSIGTLGGFKIVDEP